MVWVPSWSDGPTASESARGDGFRSLEAPVLVEYLFALLKDPAISSSSGMRVCNRLLICTGGEPGVGSWTVTSGTASFAIVSGMEMKLFSRVRPPTLSGR